MAKGSKGGALLGGRPLPGGGASIVGGSVPAGVAVGGKVIPGGRVMTRRPGK